MVKVGIRCQNCRETFSVTTSVERSGPTWARRLWKEALAAGWARRVADHAVFCSNCQAQLDGLSTRINPLAPIQFVTLLECDGCGAQFQGEEAVIDKHFNRALRAAAKKQGWIYTSLDQNNSYQDYCPTCAPEVTRDRREDLLRLVWAKPTQTAARSLGISDKALEKQCKRWQVPKPPRGFWAKWNAGHFAECRALIPADVVETLGPEFLNEIYPLSS